MAATNASSATKVEKSIADIEERFDALSDPDAGLTHEEREAFVRMPPEDPWTARY